MKALYHIKMLEKIQRNQVRFSDPAHLDRTTSADIYDPFRQVSRLSFDEQEHRQSIPSKHRLGQEQKIKKEFQNAMILLEKARANFAGSTMGVTKSWYIQAVLMVDKVKHLEEIKDEILLLSRD